MDKESVQLVRIKIRPPCLSPVGAVALCTPYKVYSIYPGPGLRLMCIRIYIYLYHQLRRSVLSLHRQKGPIHPCRQPTNVRVLQAHLHTMHVCISFMHPSNAVYGGNSRISSGVRARPKRINIDSIFIIPANTQVSCSHCCYFIIIASYSIIARYDMSRRLTLTA